jgi:hypothetical protein
VNGESVMPREPHDNEFSTSELLITVPIKISQSTVEVKRDIIGKVREKYP